MIFISVLTISSIFGINFYRSFWGTGVRGEGLVTYFHLFLFFIILTSVFYKKKDWLQLLKITVLVSFFVSISIIFQKLGVISLSAADSLSSRPSGVLGNPDFVPGYLIFGTFLALFLSLLEKSWQKRAFWAIAFFLNIFALLLTKTRGGWIGFFCAFTFLLVSFLVFYRKRFPNLKKIILLTILFILIFALVVLFNQDKFGVEENSYFNRYLSIFKSSDSLKLRLISWQTGFSAFTEKPLLGWGVESYNFIYDKFFKIDYFSTLSVTGGFDRAHNKIFNLLAENGILGLLSYLSIFFLVFYYLFKYKLRGISRAFLQNKPNINSFIPFVFASLFIGYFIQNLFLFDTLSSYISFFLILGFLNKFSSELPGSEIIPKKEDGLFRKLLNFGEDNKKRESLKLKTDTLFARLGYKKLVLFVGVVIFITFIICQINLRPFLSNIYFYKGYYLTEKNCRAASENFQKSFGYHTYLNQEFSIIGAQKSFSVLEKIKYKKEKENIICSKAVFTDLILFKKSLEKATQSPNIKYAASLRLLGKLNINLYLLSGDIQYLKDAEKALLKSTDYKSQLPVVYQFLGEIKMLQGKEKEAIDFYEKAKTLLLLKSEP